MQRLPNSKWELNYCGMATQTRRLNTFETLPIRNKETRFTFHFWGCLLARAQRKWAAAVELCEMAISLRRNEAQLYLNLAEVYVAAGRRDDAVEVLDRGFDSIPG